MSQPTDSTENSNSGFAVHKDLYKNIDVAFYEPIISGHLRPFLSAYNSPKELQKLTTITVKGEFEVEEIQKWNQNGSIPKEVLERFNVTEGDHISFKVSDNKALYITFSKPEDQVNSVFDINLPDPPSEKAKAFLHHLRIEFDLMKNNAYKVLQQSDCNDHLALYANKNIQSLKDLAIRAEKLFKKINPENKHFLEDANLYVIYVVKEFLIYSIMFYQELFQPFLNYDIEEYNALKRALFGKKYPSLLPENNSVRAQKKRIADHKEISGCPNAFTLKAYNSKYTLLTYVMISLKTNGFISEYTDIKDFRKIFNNETPLNSIKWLTSISDLSHFIRLLHNTYKVIENIDKVKWKVTDKLFVNENGRHFGWENFRGKKIPSKARLIENAVEFLK